MRVPRKWRPSLGLLIASMVTFLVVLPFAALVAARVTSNQFVRETEANLHAQAAVYTELYAEMFERLQPEPNFGTPISDIVRQRLLKDFHPIDPNLVSSSRAIQPPRPDPLAEEAGIEPAHRAISGVFSEIAHEARKISLAGVLALDHRGRIIARSGTETGSLAHVDEVARALQGEIVSVARWREEEYRNHSIRSISRDTKFRVFVAHPVIVADRVIGVVYLSRTPSNLNKYLFQQRHTFIWLFAILAVSAVLVGLFFWRFLTRPLQSLSAQAADIAKGSEREKLPKYGVREIASLGQSIMDMGISLRKQATMLETYTKHATHELKSPVTSIMGAAELLESDRVTDERRLALAGTIKADASRMDQLLLGMREMVRGQVGFSQEPTDLNAAAQTVRSAFPELAISVMGDATAKLPIPKGALEICFNHLLQNAQEHDATTVTLTYSEAENILKVDDNGAGLAEGNAAKATEPFFTTKRSSGGTGLGLAICSEIVAQYDGVLEIGNGEQGASVTIAFEEQ